MAKHQTEWTEAHRAAICYAVLAEGRKLPDVLERAKVSGLSGLRHFDMPYSTAAAYVNAARRETHLPKLKADPVPYVIEQAEQALAGILERQACGGRNVTAREINNTITLANRLEALKEARSGKENGNGHDDESVSEDVAELLASSTSASSAVAGRAAVPSASSAAS